MDYFCMLTPYRLHAGNANGIFQAGLHIMKSLFPVLSSQSQKINPGNVKDASVITTKASLHHVMLFL